MSTETVKNAIEEVRDQLSLDYADGQYLNNLSANLGLDRPPFGFSDDTWRAVVRILALQPKQIRQKFIDVLEVIFGPQVTQVGTHTNSVNVGSQSTVLNSVEGIPQVGTMVLDEGLSTEETVEYCFIDRTTKTVQFETPLTHAHSANDWDAESFLIVPATAGDTELIVSNSNLFPTTGFPFTLLVGRGTSSEETVLLLGNDVTTGVLTTSALANDHDPIAPTPLQDELDLDYVPPSEFLVLENTEKFPNTGVILFGPSTNTFTVGVGSTTTVIETSGLTEARHVGDRVKFTGNVTSALQDVEGYVVANTDTTITLFSALGTAPASGDTFAIRTVVDYVGNNPANNSLQIQRDLVDVTVSVNTEIELLNSTVPVSLAPVQVKGKGWSVVQSTAQKVELYIPDLLQDIQDLRSASYLHANTSSPSTTTTAAVTAADTSVEADVSSFEETGLAVLDDGGGNEEVFLYSRARRSSPVSAFSSTGVEASSSIFGFAGTSSTIYISDTTSGVEASRTIGSVLSPTEVTFTDPLSSEVIQGLLAGRSIVEVVGQDDISVYTEGGLVNAQSLGESLDYFNPKYASTQLDDGNVWTLDNVFPGPYVYDIQSLAPTAYTANTELIGMLAGPTRVVVTRPAGATALEVENATAFPLGVVSPFTIVVGEFTGNRETTRVSDVSLRTRTVATLTSSVTPGDTSLPINSTIGSGVASSFPNANGYRVVINKGGVGEEIAFVTGTTGGNTLSLRDPLIGFFSAGTSIHLVSDVLTVDLLDDAHIGFIESKNASGVSIAAAGKTPNRNRPTGAQTTVTTAVAIGDTAILVADNSDFSQVGSIFVNGSTYRYSKSAADTTRLTVLSPEGVTEAIAASSLVTQLKEQTQGELVQILYSALDVASVVGFDVAGSNLFINFGEAQTGATAFVDAGTTAGATVINVASAAEMPTTFPYVVTVGKGTYLEEKHIVTGISGNTLTINYGVNGLLESHPAGAEVALEPSASESFTYSSIEGFRFEFNPAIVLQSDHYAGESVIRSATRSNPRTNGYDFPLRMPTEVAFRLEFLIDLIRAAGIQVTIIDKL
jgi:hypothetical protein